MHHAVELKDVTIYVPGRREPVLRELHMAVRQGEWLLITGRNGCGKSVLARLLAGLDGRFDGELRRSARGRAVQLVMQNPEAQLVGETVWEDMLFGLESLGVPAEQIGERARRALWLADLAGLEERPVKRLSGGQKQLLALAGAIAAEPSVLVADEATSMLDPVARSRVLGLLQELHRQGVAIVMVTQLLEEARYADRLLALDRGGIAYDGGVQEFFYGRGNGGGGSYGGEMNRAEQASPDMSACERLGLAPPYAVQVARTLLRRGMPLHGCPLSPEDLEKAVNRT